MMKKASASVRTDASRRRTSSRIAGGGGILPVILGTDVNAYGMARAFHEAYGKKALVVGRAPLFTTEGSTILNLEIHPELEDETRFSEVLLEIGRREAPGYAGLILVASSDGYAEQIIRNAHQLKSVYCVPFIDDALMSQLYRKAPFYALCEQMGLAYPKTHVLEMTTMRSEEVAAIEQRVHRADLGWPLVVKPSNSVAYFQCQFSGKKKAYIVEDMAEALSVLRRIAESGYEDALILQEFIPGDDSHMRVLNCLSDAEGTVRLMSLGQPLLEDCVPTLVGNYTAIIDAYDADVFAMYKRFLEGIGYVGFSNFDMKYDARTGRYVVFEINLRQGRSSYFVTGSGYNQMRFLIEAFFETTAAQRRAVALGTGADQPVQPVQPIPDTVYACARHLWLGIPSDLLGRYVASKPLLTEARARLRDGAVSRTLAYKADKGMKRRLRVKRYYGRYRKQYKLYFKRDMSQ